MKKQYSRLFWGCTLFSGVLVLTGVCMLLFGLVLPAQNDLLSRNLYDRVSSATLLARPLFHRALTTSDDIMLLIQTENLARTEDVSSVYIVDSSATVTMHNQTGEWGRKYSDACTRKAAATKAPLYQRCPDGYLYSVPVTSAATLCVQISDERIAATQRFASRRALFVAAVFTLALSSLAFVFFRLKIEAPLRRLLVYIGALGPGIEAPHPPDTLGIAAAVSELDGRYRRDREQVLEAAERDRKARNRLIEEAVSAKREIAAVFDADGRAVAVTEKGRIILGVAEGEPRGKHLLDCVSAPEMLSIINHVTAVPGTEAVAKHGNTPVHAKSVVVSDGKLAGVIIEVEIISVL